MLIRQTSFHAGEVAPNLYSRTDVPTRKYAAASLRNFIPTATGAAINRSGFKLIGTLKDETRKARLIPFTFSTNQAYLLEFGNLYVRVWQGGAALQVSGASAYSAAVVYNLNDFVSYLGVNYRSLVINNIAHQPDINPSWWTPVTQVELSTTYTDLEIPTLGYSQSADTLTLTHPNHAAAELKRIGAGLWSLADVSTARKALPPSGLLFGTPAPVTAADDTHSVKPWEWVATNVVTDPTRGILDEESPPSGDAISTCQTAPDRPIQLTLASTDTGSTLTYWYRGRGGIWGYLGSSTGMTFTDEGQVPNYSDRPPSQLNPFANGQNPAVSAYFQQRRLFGNLPSFPQRIIGSKVGRHRDFDYSIPQKKDDAIDFTVSSLMYEEIRAMVPQQHLVILTANTEYIVDTGGRALAFDTTQLTPISYNGCSWVRPLVCGDSVLYIPPAQSSVRELAFQGDGSWENGDVSLTANHLLASAGRTIVDWAFQRIPYSVVWAVRDDGALLSLTYDPGFKVSAWAHHDSGTDIFESIACVPEGSENVLYAIVRRDLSGVAHRRIERMTPRTTIANVADGNFLDASVQSTGQIITGLSHLEGRSVMALRDGVVEGPFTVTGGQVTLSQSGTKVFVGLSYNSEIELLDLTIDASFGVQGVGPEEKLVSRVIWEVDRTAGLSAGESFGALIPWRAPFGQAAAVGGLYHDLFVVPIDSSWNRYGKSVLRQSQPLPVSVLGVSRDVQIGGI